ncbi:hypothetical protein ACHAQH_008963 [Verticillium albo-atrum]
MDSPASAQMPSTTHIPVDAADEEPYLLLISTTQAELIETFRTDVRLCETDAEKFRLCEEMRSQLLDKYTEVGLLIALFERVMLAECPDYRSYKKTQAKADRAQNDAEEWARFIGVAASGADIIEKCLPHLKSVSVRWGREKVQHYNWPARGWKFCKKLGAVANKMGWAEMVIKANQLLSRRAQMNGMLRRHHIRESPDPLDLVELENLGKWSSEDSYVKDKDPENISLPFREVSTKDLPHEYDFDQYGLLVWRQFKPPAGIRSTDSRFDMSIGKVFDNGSVEGAVSEPLSSASSLLLSVPSSQRL